MGEGQGLPAGAGSAGRSTAQNSILGELMTRRGDFKSSCNASRKKKKEYIFFDLFSGRPA